MSGRENLRRLVLAAFKDLHQARLQTFRGDEKALKAGRDEINQHFRNNKDVTDPKVIEELITVAKDSASILRKHVVQIEQVGDKEYRANITKDTYKFDNVEYRDVAESELLGNKRKKTKRCADAREDKKSD